MNWGQRSRKRAHLLVWTTVSEKFSGACPYKQDVLVLIFILVRPYRPQDGVDRRCVLLILCDFASSISMKRYDGTIFQTSRKEFTILGERENVYRVEVGGLNSSIQSVILVRHGSIEESSMHLATIVPTDAATNVSLVYEVRTAWDSYPVSTP